MRDILATTLVGTIVGGVFSAFKLPNLNEFIGPKPEQIHKAELEKIGGAKPCAKCDADSEETFGIR